MRHGGVTTYLAEINGKMPAKFEGSEDVLTSNVFSFLKYSTRKVYLKEFLTQLKIDDVSDEELENAEFLFWPKYSDGTEPDVVLLVGKYYLLFEAKYFASFDKGKENIRDHQLIREIENGSAEAKLANLIFKLIAITADPCYRAEKFSDLPPTHYNKFQWTNWQMVAKILRSLLENAERKTSKSERLFADDLLSLLTKKELRGFQTFERLAYDYPCPSIVFLDIKGMACNQSFAGFSTVLSAVNSIDCLENELFYK